MDIPMVGELIYLPAGRAISLTHYDYGDLEGPEADFIEQHMRRLRFRLNAPMCFIPDENHELYRYT